MGKVLLTKTGRSKIDRYINHVKRMRAHVSAIEDSTDDGELGIELVISDMESKDLKKGDTYSTVMNITDKKTTEHALVLHEGRDFTAADDITDMNFETFIDKLPDGTLLATIRIEGDPRVHEVRGGSADIAGEVQSIISRLMED
ncbi:MAG: hypothetical protein IKD86_06815 [Firmicutes bacterium]|nr:hypothetical protein [Bacillota bacterium]